MNCRKASRLLTAFVAAELPSPASTALRAHLCACPPCRLEASRQLQAMQALQRRPDPELAADFFASLHAQVMAKVATLPPPRRDVAPRVPSWRSPLTAAAAVLLFASGLWLARPDGTGFFERTPLAAPRTVRPVAHPYAVDGEALLPLGDESGGAAGSQGMMGRAALRTLERESPFDDEVLRLLAQRARKGR